MESGADLSAWIDAQSAARQPAVLMIFEEDEDQGFVYLANGPALGVPVIVALAVPREYRETVGTHINFLAERHRDGHPVEAGHTTSQKCGEGGYFVFKLVAPSAKERRQLMRDELVQARLRWPKAPVLALVPLDADEVQALPRVH